MVVPPPPFDLKDHCSVIHDGNLYVYSPSGFASLPLERNGTWTKLGMGKAVTGGVCVKGGVDGDNNQTALYVVGGKASTPDNSGLQRYTFSTGRWDTILAGDGELKDYLDHGAAYMNSSSSILVYAGAPNGTAYASTTTWLISTVPPYTVLAGTAEVAGSSIPAPPAISPELLPWNDHEIALVAGFTTSSQIYLYDGVTRVWSESGVSLASSLPVDTHCALLNGADGSKVLEAFYLDASPNYVENLALLNPGGTPANPARPVGNSSSPTRKREYTSLSNFPVYNGTYAPKSIWKSYSLAEGGGLVVISGGSGTDALSIFNQSSNGWVNATKLFYGDQAIPQAPVASSTASSSAASTSSMNNNSSSVGSSSSVNAGKVVGATLGSVGVLLAIFVLLLLLLKRKKKGVSQDRPQRASSYHDRLSFQDTAMESLTQSAYPIAKGPVPRAMTPVALANPSSNMRNDRALDSQASNYLEASTSRQQTSLSTLQPATGAATVDRQSGSPGDRRTDESWSRYFQGSTVADLTTMRSIRDTLASGATKSDYRGSGWQSEQVPAVSFGFLEEPKPLGQVTSGSPTTTSAPSDKDGRSLVMTEGMSARISNISAGSYISEEYDDDPRDKFSSGVPESVHGDSNWLQVRERSWLGRPPSSTYSRDAARDSSMAESTERPVSDYELAEEPHYGGRRSSVILPGNLDPPSAGASNNINSDMSWLNLNMGR